MDCDDTHEPKYIPNIISKLEQGYDVVVASRFEKGGAARVEVIEPSSVAAEYLRKSFFQFLVSRNIHADIVVTGIKK